MIPAAQLAEWRAACEGASEGPWTWWTSNSFRRLTGADGRDGGVASAVTHPIDRWPDIQISREDMAFIALSRTALPALLAEVERGREEIAEARRQRDAFMESAADARAVLGFVEGESVAQAAARVATEAGELRAENVRLIEALHWARATISNAADLLEDEADEVENEEVREGLAHIDALLPVPAAAVVPGKETT